MFQWLKILEKEKRMDDLVKSINEIKLMISETNTDVKETKTIINDIRDEIRANKKEIKYLKKVVSQQQEKIIFLDNKLRQNNIVIHGLAEEADESFEQLHQLVGNVLNEKVGMNLSNQDIDNVYRMGRKRTGSARSILTSFTTLRVRNEIMRKKGVLKGTDIFITEDFSKVVREARKELGKVARTLRERGEVVKLRYDKLLVNGKLYDVDASKDLLDDPVTATTAYDAESSEIDDTHRGKEVKKIKKSPTKRSAKRKVSAPSSIAAFLSSNIQQNAGKTPTKGNAKN